MTPDERRGALRDAIRRLHTAGDVIEVRAIGEEALASGYFDNQDLLTGKILLLDEDPRVQGIYLTLNEVNPALLSRRANRVKMRLSKKDATTADGDIIRRRWLPVDIDPVRPSGVSSSESEHEAAIGKAYAIAAYLGGIGWPDPVIADSGNGAHLLWRIDLKNDDESRDLVKNCLAALDLRFSDPGSRVDTGNYNAGRIWKCYGTTSKKGDHTAERPHRVSRILTAPEVQECVPLDQLRQLAALYPVALPGKSSRHDTALDLAGWLTGHGLSYTEKPYRGGTLFLLDVCPFSADHTDGAYAIQFPNGAIFAGCHHASCGGGTQRWSELRRRYEKRDPAARMEQLRAEKASAKHEAAGRDDIPPGDDAVHGEAERICTTGDPLRFMLDAFSHEHEGDLVVAECLILSLASRLVINSKGLHVSITGESGKGKSHAIDTMLDQVPEEVRLDGRMSDKALFYIKDMQPGTVIALDDVSLSDQMQEILKGVTTSFQKPFLYRTVTKDRTGLTCIIPERCVWWVAKVEGTGDDQVFNRMLTCWIDDSEDQDSRVLSRMLHEAGKGPAAAAGKSGSILVSREIWRCLKDVFVVIPYADRIQFQSAENRRNPDMLLDLVKAHAMLNQQQRVRKEENGVVSLLAEIADFREAARLYSALNGDTGSQMSKLTKRESSLIAMIRLLGQEEVTIFELQRKTGWANSTIHKLLNGYITRGQTYSGLLEKCPAISFLDKTVTTGEDGMMSQRRMKVYLWDDDLYTRWAQGSSVWLSGEEVGDDEDPSGDDPGDRGDPSGAGERGSGGQIAVRAEGAAHNPGADLSVTKKEHIIQRDHPVQAEESGHTGPHDDVQNGTDDPASDPAGAARGSDLTPPRPPSPVPAINRSPVRPAFSRIGPHLPLPAIDPRLFTRVPGWPEKKPCAVCKRTRTVYAEKKGRKGKYPAGHDPRYLCESCYTRAVSRYTASCIALPGTIDPFRMVRQTASIGSCHLCGMGPVAWYDPVTRTGLCETCFSRERRRPGEGSG